MNNDIEKLLLSSAIFDGSIDNLLKDEVEAKHFLNPTYQNIYEAMISLHKKEMPIDEVFLIKQLDKSYEDILVDLLSLNPILVTTHYTNILKEQYQLDIIAKFNRNSLHNISKNDSLESIKKEMYTFIDNIENKHNNELFISHQFDQNLKEEVDFICKEFLPFPKKTVSMVCAGGGVGKTWLMLNIAIREANKGQKVFAWMSEDSLGETMNRIIKIKDNILIGIKESLLKENLTITNSNTFHVIDKKGEISYQFYQLKKMLKDFEVIILDPLIGFYGSDENDNVHARVFMQLFTKWASDENKTIIFIHHSTKNTTQSRGASAFVDAVRVVYEVEKIEDDALNRQIKLTKDNYNVINILKQYKVKKQLFPPKFLKEDSNNNM